MITTYLLFRLPAVQTWATQRVASYLSKQLNAKISIQGVDINLFKTLVLEDLLVEDQYADTLLFVHELKVDIGPIILEKNKFTINKAELNNPVFHLRKYKGEKTNNLQFILDYLSSPQPEEIVASKPIDLKVKSLKIENADFIYHNENIPAMPAYVIDFDNVHVRKFNADIKSFSFVNNEFRADIDLSLEEKSGFVLEQLKGKLKFTSTEIEIANMNLLTPHSNIHDYYSMRFDSLAEMSDYIEKVRMYADFRQSVVSFEDIKYFSSYLKNYKESFIINGKVSGTVSHLTSKYISINTSSKNHFSGSVSVKGLPDIYTTVFNAKVEKIKTSYENLCGLLSGIDQDSSAMVIPKELSSLGNVEYIGYYKGTVFDFETNGQLSSAIGSLVNDIHLSIVPDKKPSYSGVVETIDFNLGKLTGNDLIGAVTMDVNFNGEGFNLDDLNTKISTNVHRFLINGYDYKNIIADGLVKKKFFEGNVQSNEEHADFYFNGSIDFNDLKNPEFNFHADVKQIHLKELNISKDTINISSEINVNFIGASIDNIIGKLTFNNSSIKTKGSDIYKFQKIVVNSEYDGNGKQLSLQSDIIDLGIKGDYRLSTINSAVKSVVKKYLPSFDLGTIHEYESQDFSFYIIIDNAKPLTDLLYPQINISNKASIYGSLNTDKNIIRLNGGIDYIKYDFIKFEDLIIDGENDNNIFDFNIASKTAYINDSINIDNIAISNSIKNDSLRFNIKLSEKTSPNQLDLNGLAELKSQGSNLQILPSEIIIDYQEWKLMDSFLISFTDQRNISVSNFELVNGTQKLKVSGLISNNIYDELFVDIENVQLSNLNPILKRYDIHANGIINSKNKINGVLNEAAIVSDLTINNLVYNGDTVGYLSFNNTWNPSINIMNVNGSIYTNQLKTFGVTGTINTSKANNSLNIDVIMNETELELIQPFVKEYVSQISGVASADLKLRGSFSKPEINGYLTLKDAGVNVNYLNAYLKVSDQIRFSEDKIYLDNLQVKDIEGNRGSINGSITHHYFDQFKLDVKMNANKLLCLNTTSKDNELYFGKAYASGNFTFRGPINDIKIDIIAKTETGTKFYIPLSDESSVSKQNYIRFIEKDSLKKKEEYKVNLSGITMNMNLQVDDQSEVQLIMDPSTGEVIRGRGNANLKLFINTSGAFEMYGVYEISEGDYNFTLQNLITKKFKVDRGGTIRWNGDPLKAKINLSAVYETRPQVMPLILSANADTSNYSSSQRIKAECILKMNNDLMSPDISFGLRFPEDDNLGNQISGYLANTDNLNNQVANLLVFGRFANTATGNNSYVPTTGFLAAQLSNLVSFKNLDLNFDNGLGGSIRLFNDRITIDGSVNTVENSTANGNSQQAQTNASSITGDVNIEYKISKDGRFRAKGFQRNDNNSDLLKRGNSQIEQGVGLFYRIEFNTFGELMRKIFARKEEEEGDADENQNPRSASNEK